MYLWRNDRAKESGFSLLWAGKHGKVNIWDETDEVRFDCEFLLCRFWAKIHVLFSKGKFISYLKEEKG